MFVHLLYNLYRLSIFGFIFLLVVRIAPPVKVRIMDNVIVKDNKGPRESSATGNSKITRTWLGTLYQGVFGKLNWRDFQPVNSFVRF